MAGDSSRITGKQLIQIQAHSQRSCGLSMRKPTVTQEVAYPTTSQIAQVVRSDEARDLFFD